MSDTEAMAGNKLEADVQATGSGMPLLWLLLLVTFAALGYIFESGLLKMAEDWQRDEYSHGYMIPMVALYILWQKQPRLPELTSKGAWLGTLGVLAGLAAFFMGEMATVYEVVQYGFILALTCVFLSFFGWRPLGLVWVAFAYLIFMVPLPQFIYKALSAELQLISSALGVAVIRLFDISVFLEGNVIDLGVYQLQVVEACSGLRYLFPLMSFGFLIAYLFKAPFWQKAVLFISTVPITVLMNSFRIGVIGVTVEYWGIEMAEGFLHDFEGWVVFMGCLAVLLLEMWFLHQFVTRSPQKLWDRVDLDLPEKTISLRDFSLSWKKQMPFVVSFVLILLASIAKPMLEARDEPVLARKSFSEFPLYLHQWIGRESAIEQKFLDELKLTDYITANYANRQIRIPVNFYVAYYQSQRQGAAIHSPRTCLPGGGWKFDKLEQVTIPGVNHMSGAPLRVNRVVMRQDEAAQLVYYWFEQRGRNVTNEYKAKWYVFWDSLTKNRTDGALVRLVVPVVDGDLEASEQAANQFLQDFYGLLPEYIPGRS